MTEMTMMGRAAAAAVVVAVVMVAVAVVTVVVDEAEEEIAMDGAEIATSPRMMFRRLKRRSRFPLQTTSRVSKDLQASAPESPGRFFGSMACQKETITRGRPLGEGQQAGFTRVNSYALRCLLSQIQPPC